MVSVNFYRTADKKEHIDGLSYLPNGKPVLEDGYISISHSRHMTAVCLSDRPVGIDIEFIDESRDFLRLAERFFKGGELTAFKENPTALTFYEIWTKKEAYSKISGAGLKEIFKGFDVFSLENAEFQTQNTDGFLITVCETDI